MATWKFVKDYPIKKYKCGLEAGDLIQLKRTIAVKDHRDKPTGVQYIKGEIWQVLPGAKEAPVVVWLQQADGKTHTWDDDQSIYNTFKKIDKVSKKKGKYHLLIEGLFRQGKCVRKNHDALVNAGDKAFEPLVSSLLESYDPLIREACAEILGDRKSTKAIPFLIKALLDKNLYVRQDALWSIERLSGYQPGALQDWLDITNMDAPKKLHERILKWYKINKQYIQRII